MDNGNVSPGQMMGQWNNFEAPKYNPNQRNTDPLLAQETAEQRVEQRGEQLPENMNLVNQGVSSSYGNTAMLGGAGINATEFMNGVGEQETEIQTSLGEVVTIGNITYDEKGKVMGTDLPKAKDMDGLEPEFIKAVDQVVRIRNPGEKYRKKRELAAKLLLDRYGRVLGQGNG